MATKLQNFQTTPTVEGTRMVHKTNSAVLSVNPPLTGPEAIAHAVSKLDLAKLKEEHMGYIKAGKVSKRSRAVHVLNTIEGLERNELTPSDLLIGAVPVIPPVFRPFSIVSDVFIPGDSNELYRDLFDVRKNYERTTEMYGDTEPTKKARLMLYDSVKALFGFSEPVKEKTRQRGVSGFLKQVTGVSPKMSFFQRKLISKPVDSVGRSTIVIDPELSLDEIGVPEEIAWTSYAPYIQRRLVRLGMSGADALRNLKERSPEAKKALDLEIKERPVVYSRAPAWHKFNVIAGKPKIIPGEAIAINPFIGTGFNADFDGDQVNIHVPSHPDAVQEAYERLMPSKMLHSIREPDKVIPVPKHEMILGLHTAMARPPAKVHKFPNEQAAIAAVKSGAIPLSDEVVW
jgi:DNA-directed RNA polymerase subunit beta'